MIRRAEVSDLARMGLAAREFYASSKFLRGFELERFCSAWSALLENGSGVVFVVDTGEIVGAIGGVVYPDIYSGAPIATEFFWFIRQQYRGEGLKLYRAFEDWARERGCSQIQMVHLLDSMPEKLGRVYRHLGFEPMEIHYVKEIQA